MNKPTNQNTVFIMCDTKFGDFVESNSGGFLTKLWGAPRKEIEDNERD